ncbi:MarR family winged helix-turn-helix transcriptional regulator [Georgenia subflava]|uniref:MarR family transcriptional regulator n=1 Tax=Georgenia subflava TaxID=1622177 RepID=A0A6N7EAY0_9MICO|nr:MarR family transcriptional regulator [Georgenia subflava]MPV35542.1 MarR family transcriptional regulator [Georgenia subflava]
MANLPETARSNGTMNAYVDWADIRDTVRKTDFQTYIRKIAEARYVTRKVLRIVNDQAQEHGLDPLVHQALLQIYGSDGTALAVNVLAKRLDIAPAFASRLVRELENLGYVRRESSPTDKRVKHVSATDDGVAMLEQIDQSVYHHISYFHRQFDEEQKMAALSIFAFYVGLDSSSPVARAIREG